MSDRGAGRRYNGRWRLERPGRRLSNRWRGQRGGGARSRSAGMPAAAAGRASGSTRRLPAATPPLPAISRRADAPAGAGPVRAPGAPPPPPRASPSSHARGVYGSPPARQSCGLPRHGLVRRAVGAQSGERSSVPPSRRRWRSGAKRSPFALRLRAVPFPFALSVGREAAGVETRHHQRRRAACPERSEVEGLRTSGSVHHHGAFKPFGVLVPPRREEDVVEDVLLAELGVTPVLVELVEADLEPGAVELAHERLGRRKPP